MQLVSFKNSGSSSFGILKGQRIIDARRHLTFGSLREVLAAQALSQLEALSQHTPDLELANVELLPPIPVPPKIICVGLNYKSHVAETGRELPPYPSMFIRATNSLVASNGHFVKPAVSDHFDYEGELAAIIGTGGRHIPRDRALQHVAGYSCFNDGSLRDFQKHSVTAGKNFIGTGGFGPSLVTSEEVGDPHKLKLVTRLNGKEVQRTTTDLMIYPLDQVISYISQFTELEPGDVIATGTPEGVGARRTPPLWMKAGDVIEVEIEKLGILVNPVQAEKKND